MLAHYGDFWRHLQEEILTVEWRSFEAARQQLGQAIAWHTEAKLARGAPRMSQEVIDQFKVQLNTAFVDQALQWRQAGFPEQAEFWEQIAANIEDLAQE